MRRLRIRAHPDVTKAKITWTQPPLPSCYTDVIARRLPSAMMLDVEKGGFLMTMITGGCLCRRVRWEVTGEPAFSGVCHCRNCQRYTGSAFNAFAVFPADNVKITGELRTYDDQSDSGRPVHRRFCPNCGSGVALELASLPGMTVLSAGGYDDPTQFTPGMELFVSSAQPWLEAGAQRNRFDRMPN